MGIEKYEATAASMIALLRYGSGVPWNRLEGLKGSLGIPLPAATQCEIVAERAAVIQPALQEFIRQAAQGQVLYNDDTSMRVLALSWATGEEAGDRSSVDNRPYLGTPPLNLEEDLIRPTPLPSRSRKRSTRSRSPCGARIRPSGGGYWFPLN